MNITPKTGSSSVHGALVYGRELEVDALVSQNLLNLSIGACVVHSLDMLHNGLGVVSWTSVTPLMVLSVLPWHGKSLDPVITR